MSYSEALDALKDNECVARSGWNGKNMFLFLVREWEIVIADKQQVPAKVLKLALAGVAAPNLKFIAMFTAQGDIVPWLASQTDMLAEDWEIV